MPPRPRLKCRGREEIFCILVDQGIPAADAFRRAYVHPDWTAASCAHQAHKMMRRPCVVARLAELKQARLGKSERGTLLSLNDRLLIASRIAKSKDSGPLVKLRALEVYTKLAGDAAPDRLELTGPEGQPVQVESTVTNLTVEEKVARIRAAREARVQG